MDKDIDFSVFNLMEQYSPADITNFTVCKSLYDFQSDLRIGGYDLDPSDINDNLKKLDFHPVDGFYYLIRK